MCAAGRFCGNGIPDWAVDDALEAMGQQPAHGDFPTPVCDPVGHSPGTLALDLGPSSPWTSI